MPFSDRAIGTVILNFNGWADSVACANSVLAGVELPRWLVLADNASTDESLLHLRRWGSGRRDIVFQEMEENAVPHVRPEQRPLVVLLKLGKNGGYAAGNNSAIRLLLGCGAEAVWILNNDTIVAPQAMAELARRLFDSKRPGLCGGLICYGGNPDLVQCCAGGTTSLWTGLSQLIGQDLSLEQARQLPRESVERRLDFIYGACVLVSKTFLETVGLLDERFFLYCEEQDWAVRNRGKFELCYAPGALILHKEGASTGLSRAAFNSGRAWRLMKSRLRLVCKHAPWALPVMLGGLAFAAVRRFYRQTFRTPGGFRH